jgi:menaquinone-dependent protoporphyrinogen oxidase
MTTVEVVYGSRHGGTRGIAERIGAALRDEGVSATVVPADRATVRGADAFIVGSGVYMGAWLKEPIEFLERHQQVLAEHPVWLFSSGPLAGSTKEKQGVDPIEDALGPADGPGSGGRKKVTELRAATNAREHRVFRGAFDPNDPPKAMSERLVRAVMGEKVLPPGDFREWDKIEAWAKEIAASLAVSGPASAA